MYSDSERLTELLGEAYGSAGAGAAQFEKTQESLESKLNNLHTAWTTFTTSITNSSVIKLAVDGLTNLLNIVNKLTDAFGPLSGVVKVALGALGAYKVSNTVLPALEKSLKGKILSYMGKEFSEGAAQEGGKAGKAFSVAFSEAVKSYKNRFESIKNYFINDSLTSEDVAKLAALGKQKADAEKAAYDAAMLGGEDAEWAMKMASAAAQGTAEAEAEIAAIEAKRKPWWGKQIVQAAQQGYKEGVAAGNGFATGLKGSAKNIVNVLSGLKFSPLGIMAVVAGITLAVAKIADANSEYTKAKKRVEEIREENEKITSELETQRSEIEQLESKGDNLTAAEKARLEILKKQTAELEKQRKANLQEEYEQQKKTQQHQVITYKTQRVNGKETQVGQSEMVGGAEAIDTYLEQMNQKITEREEAYANGADQEALDKIDKEIQEYKTKISNIMTTDLEPYLEVADEADKKAYFKGAQSQGIGIEALANVDETSYNALISLRDAGNLTDITISNLAASSEDLKIYMEAAGASAKDLADELNNLSTESKNAIRVENYKKAAEEIKDLKKSVNAVGDAFSSLYKDGYVDIDKLSTLANDDAFANLDSFADYLDLLGKAGKEDIPKVTAATEQLLDELMGSEAVLTNLNNSTVGLYENMLKNMGVTNAHEVVTERLNLKLAEQSIAEMEAADKLDQFSGSAEQAKANLAGLAKQYGVTEQAIAYFVVKTRLANANALSTKASRTELSKLVDSLGIAASALVKYNALMNNVDLADKYININRAKMEAATDETAVQYYATAVEGYRRLKNNKLQEARDLLNGELNKIDLSSTTPTVNSSQFNTSSSKSSSNTEKEIQKLSELYNAKKKVAEIEEKISDLEEARKTLQNYDDQLANEHEQIEALKEKKKLTQDLIDQNEVLRAQKLAMAKAEWAPLYNYDEATHEITLTQEYFNAINKNGKATKKWSADVLNNFKEWVEEYDDIVEFSRDEQNILAEINTTLLERWESYRDDYIDLVNELADLYEKQEKDQIDALKEKYDKMKELDDKYLEELRKNIEARRDARDRENDVEEITKKQKRLNMLMRDTSGRNASEIVDLQKEIEDAQQDLIDEDVDRILDSLEDANDKDQENWDNAISKLEDQLEQDKENGKFIRLAEEALQKSPEEIKQLFKEFYETQGPYSQAEIIKMLEEVEDKLVGALDYRDGKNPTIGDDGYGSGSNGKYRQTKYLDPNGRVQTGYVSVANGQTYKDTNLTERIDEGSIVPNATNPNKGWKLVNGKGQEMTLSEEQKKLLGITGTSSSSTAAAGSTTTTTSRAKVANTGGKGLNLRASASASSQKLGAYPDGTAVTVLDDSNAEWWKVRCNGKTGYMSAKYLKKYANGGLVDYTGPAWVDGNPSHPEAFLSAKDTKNFTELKELLAMFLREDRSKNFTSGGAQSKGDCNIYITVDQIASDYDIDEAVARVRQEIMSGSNYRNINLVNRRR